MAVSQDNATDAGAIRPVESVLQQLRREGKVLVALLYGSFHKGTHHHRSDIDLALFIRASNEEEEIDIVDRILMSSDREISILRLDDTDESPFIVQEALKGKHLVEPDEDALYYVYHWALHESESIRFRRGMSER
jgi:predicted nucleotidyltransferase